MRELKLLDENKTKRAGIILEKMDHGVECLLFAVDCLSRYLRVEPPDNKIFNKICRGFPKDDQTYAT